MYTHIDAYTHIYTCFTHICIHTGIHTCTYRHVHTKVYVYIYLYTCICDVSIICIYIFSYMHMSAHICIYVNINTCLHVEKVQSEASCSVCIYYVWPKPLSAKDHLNMYLAMRVQLCTIKLFHVSITRRTYMVVCLSKICLFHTSSHKLIIIIHFSGWLRFIPPNKVMIHFFNCHFCYVDRNS